MVNLKKNPFSRLTILEATQMMVLLTIKFT